MIKAVLFDMDGILFDSEGFYFQGNLNWLRELGYQGDEKELLKGVGLTVDNILRFYHSLLDGKVPLEQLYQINDAYYKNHPINYYELMFEGVPEITKKLKEEGYLLACCSSSPYNMIEDGLNQMGIRDNFTYIQSAEDVKAPKPNPAVYLAALNYFGLKKEECIVYEDSDIGIEAGKKAGMLVVAREDLRFGQSQKEADVIVKDIYELYAWIERKNHYAGNY